MIADFECGECVRWISQDLRSPGAEVRLAHPGGFLLLLGTIPTSDWPMRSFPALEGGSFGAAIRYRRGCQPSDAPRCLRNLISLSHDTFKLFIVKTEKFAEILA
jgi:hypothetical protein